MTPSQEMRQAREAGRAAAEAKHGPHGNPYRGTGPTARERMLSVVWRRGHQAVTARMPVDYGS